MLRLVTGKYLSKDDKEILRLAVIYTLSYLVPEKKLKGRKLTVVVRPGKAEEETTNDVGGLSWFDKKKNRAYIWLDSDLIGRRGKKSWTRLRYLLELLVHELVHVKQFFVDNDYDNAQCPGDEEAYWSAPQEIEAYGRTPWLMIRLERLINSMNGRKFTDSDGDLVMDDKTARKFNGGKAARKQKKKTASNEEQKIGKVGIRKAKWHYNPNKDYEYDDSE